MSTKEAIEVLKLIKAIEEEKIEKERLMNYETLIKINGKPVCKP